MNEKEFSLLVSYFMLKLLLLITLWEEKIVDFF